VSGAFARAMLDELGQDELRRLADLLAPYMPAPAADADRWMGTREAAAYLGMSANAVHKRSARRERGGIPFHQDTDKGKLWFLRSELDDWRRRGG
jgi:hypothetical protein